MVKDWLSSLNGTIVLSTIQMLSFIAYAFLEALYFLGQWITGIGTAALMVLVIVTIIGGWIWGLLIAIAGDSRGLIMALVFSSLPALFTLYDLVFYSPVRYGWPLVQIVVWITFLSSLVAIVAIALQLARG